VIPPGPAVPRVCAVTDGTNLLAEARAESGLLKVIMEDVADAQAVSAAIDGQPVASLEWFQTDPIARRFEFNLQLPPHLLPGNHNLELCHGARRFPAIAIEVA
jgi:hypothetical protein